MYQQFSRFQEIFSWNHRSFSVERLGVFVICWELGGCVQGGLVTGWSAEAQGEHWAGRQQLGILETIGRHQPRPLPSHLNTIESLESPGELFPPELDAPTACGLGCVTKIGHADGSWKGCPWNLFSSLFRHLKARRFNLD